MVNKKVIISTLVILSLSIPFSVYAAKSDSNAAKNFRNFFKIESSKLNDQQKSDVKGFAQRSADLQKEFINKMLANGSVTKEQADAELKKIDERLSGGDNAGFLPGFGGRKVGPSMKEGRGGKGGPGMFAGRGEKFGPAMMQGRGGSANHRVQGSFSGFCGVAGLDISKLNDTQKADIIETAKKMVAQQKDFVSKQVANGLITKEQGDQANIRIDKIFADVQANGFTKMSGMDMGMFARGAVTGKMMGKASGKLNDQQKADILDNSKKMADIQKELVNKLIANGALTKEKGDAALKRIDDMSNMQKEGKFKK